MIRDLQFAIRMRFVNSVNKYIQVHIRRFVFMPIQQSSFFDEIKEHEFPSVHSY